jgi:hypothetical protein
MPDACAAATMAVDGMTAAPAVPAISAAPAGALVRLITAPIPAGAIPAVVIPTIVLVIEGKVLDFFDRGALPRTNRLPGSIADASLRAAGQERKEEREQQGGVRKQARHRSPSIRADDRATAARRIEKGRQIGPSGERAHHLTFA